MAKTKRRRKSDHKRATGAALARSNCAVSEEASSVLLCSWCQKPFPKGQSRQKKNHERQCSERHKVKSNEENRKISQSFLDGGPLPDCGDDLEFFGAEDEKEEERKAEAASKRKEAPLPPELLLDPVNGPVGMVCAVRPMNDTWFLLDEDSDEDTDNMEEEEEHHDDGGVGGEMDEQDTGHRQTLEEEGEPQANRGDTRSIGGAVAEESVLNVLEQQQEDPMDLEETYQSANKNGVEIVKEWSKQRSPGQLAQMTDCELKRLLQTKEGRTLGLCARFDREEMPPPLQNKELSMLRLIDFVNMRPRSGRNFVDDFLDLLVEEMNDRGFDPRNRPSREAVSKKAMDMFGKECAPQLIQMTAANEDRLIRIQEDPLEGKNRNTDADNELIEISGQQIANSDAYKAIPKQIDNRERFMVDLISYNTANQLKDLLGDTEIFSNLENLVVNPSNPFDPYVNKKAFADEILDGSWYRDTIERLEKLPSDPFDKEFEFVLPIIMYVDKTGTSMNQRYPLEPLMMTTAIIRRSVRIRPSSWRPLGFIPDLETKSSAEQRFLNRTNQGTTSQAYHCALEHLLLGMEEVQEKGIVHWLQLGKHKKKVRLRPEVAFVINDGKSADMITLRYPSHFPSRRDSRSCKTIHQHSDKTSGDCEFVKADKQLTELFRRAGMSAKEAQEDPVCLKESNKARLSHEEGQSLVELAKEQLKDKSFHPVRNAFLARCIRFGLDPRNIWGANPIDLMHAFQSGVLMYLVKMILDNLTPKKQVELDRLVHKLFHALRCHERKNYPRMNFSKGFSKLTLLTSDEWAGKLFVILIVLHTEEGKRLFKTAKTFADVDVELPKNWKGMSVVDQAKYMEKKGDQKDLLRPTAKAIQTVMSRAEKSPSTVEDEEMLLEMAEEQARKEQEKGKQANQTADKKKKRGGKEEEPEEMLQKCSAEDFVELAEALLCFHAWYKMGVNKVGPDGKINTTVIRNSVAILLSRVRHYCPRKKGNGWKIQKFHDLLHLAVDMERFGPPSNFDAGPMESGLKFWAKLPALTSQTRGYSTFVKQVASRLHEFQCIGKALRMHGLGREKMRKKKNDKLAGQDKGEEINSLGGTRYRVYCNKTNNPETEAARGTATYPLSHPIRKKGCKSHFPVSPAIENFLRFQSQEIQNETLLPPTEAGESMFWELRTEATIVHSWDPDNPMKFRCHPNFNNEGAWHDWAMVHFDKPDNVETVNGFFTGSYLPAKILAFALDPIKPEKIWALVHGCDWRSSREQDSVLVEHWQLAYHDVSHRLPRWGRNKSFDGTRTSPQLHLAPTLTWVGAESILSPCLVIEEEPGIHEYVPVARLPNRKTKTKKNRVLLLRGRHKWPKEFTSELVD